MKKFLVIITIIPFFAFAQNSTKPVNSKGFEITGNVTGYEDGTSVSFLNQQTQQPEKQATIEKGKFVIKGQLPEPSFVILIFADQPPAIPLFIDNSKIKIEGDKKNIDNLSITGSKTQDQFEEYSKALKPYEKVLAPDAEKDPESVAAIQKISENFVKKYPSSFVDPIAIIRILQTSGDVAVADKLFESMAPAVKGSQLSKYVDQQLDIAKVNPIGSEIADFSQSDTAGKTVKISSFRGKYVLIDFWASWCGPCRMENPNVVAAFNKYHEKNFTILGVSLDQAKPAWLNAIHADGLTWTHVSDLKGWANVVATQFHIIQIPQNLLIDPNGKIIAKNLRGEELNQKLKELFN